MNSPCSSVSRLASVASLALLASAPARAPSEPARPPSGTEDSRARSELVYYDRAAPDGSLSGGVVRIPLPARSELRARIGAPWRTVREAGGEGPAAESADGIGPANRVDMVFV